MYRDNQLTFSDSQALTSTADSTNTIDWGTTVRDPGTGQSLYVVVAVTVALTAGGISVTVTLKGDSTAAFGAAKTRDLFVIPASTAAGSIFYARLDSVPMSGNALVSTGFPETQRFWKLTYTVSGGTLTTGTVTAFIASDIQLVYYYASGFVAAA